MPALTIEREVLPGGVLRVIGLILIEDEIESWPVFDIELEIFTGLVDAEIGGRYGAIAMLRRLIL